MPTSDSVGKTLSNDNQLFDFTVKSSITGNQAVSYEVTAVKDASSTLKNDEVRLYLEKSTDGNNYSEVMEPTVYTLGTTDDDFGAKSGEMILDRGTISTTETTYYRLRMWVGKNYEFK